MTDLIAKLDALFKRVTPGSVHAYGVHVEGGTDEEVRHIAKCGWEGEAEFYVALRNSYPQLREMARDAERYQLCQREGFPVRNQTLKSEDVRWTIRGKWFGATPSLCIDAAMQGEDKSALHGKETSK